MKSAPGKAKSSSSSTRLTRRSFIQSTAVVGGQVMVMSKARAASGPGFSLEGYTGAPSAIAGGTMNFFLRDPQALGSGSTSYPITITRVGAPDVYMTSTTVAIGNQAVPANASTQGCGWVRTYQLAIPSNWPSGLYYAYVGSGEAACTVPFVVRAATPTAGVKTIVNVPVLTVHAYNAYGGKSIYDYNSTGGVRASQVSLDRPFTEAFNSFFDTWSQYLVRWMAKNNIAADFCTDWDIETNPALLAPYQLYVQAGHDEYWSTGRRNTMDAFVARGGNCAYLGGNTAWFQSRLEAGSSGASRTLVSYKDAGTTDHSTLDPIADPALKTINWINLVPPRPENQTTGLGFVTGCSWASGTIPRPVTNSVVMRPEHWAFAGTSLVQGSGYGGAYVGYECDSAAFVTGADNRPYPTGVDGTPATLRILSQADGSNWDALSLAAGGTGEANGYAHVAVFCRGGTAGTVFNAGATDWAYGLRPELDGQTPTPISRITLNVLNQLARPWSESADVRQFHNVVGGLNNGYYGTGTTAPAGSGMALDGWVFRAYPLQAAGTVPVYRYRSTNSDATRVYYLLRTSTTAPVAGMVQDAIAFYAYAAARSDATPIYEHYAQNTTLGARVALYSPVVTPPAGWSAGPVVFHAPTDSANTTVPTTPGFTLTPALTTLAVAQGKTVSDAITVTPVNGFAGTVAFTAAGLPAGVSAVFTPVAGGTSLALAVGAAVTPGSYAITVTGTAAGTTGPVSIGLTLVVSAIVVPPQSFTLAANPTSLRLPFLGLFGASASIAVTGVNGFNSAVSFSVSGLPSGLSATFAPASSASRTTLTLSKNLFGLVLPGSYTATITGRSGSLSATTRLTVVISLLL